MIETYRDLCPESAGDTIAQSLDGALDQFLGFHLEAANGAAQDGIVRDDVPRLAGVYLRDADDCRLAWMDIAGNHRLQRQNQLAAGDQRIDAFLRHRRMAAVPAYRDLEGAGTRHHRTRHHGHFADRYARPVVEAEYRVHRKLVEQSVGDHHCRPTFGFLGGLEDEVDDSVEIQLVAVCRQVARGTEQHCRVAVMTTGMHSPLVSRTMRTVVLLLQGQGIHVGAQTDGALTAAFAQHADDAGPGEAAVDL